MSGSRALASARRRRANPDEARRNQPPLPPPVSTHINQQPTTTNVKPLSKNPMELLLKHNKMITDLQDNIGNLESTMNHQSQEMYKKINNMNMDDNSIAFFKEKVSAIEQQMNEIKKHIIKVQTFTMDTSNMCQDLRRKMNLSTTDVNEQLAEAASVTNTLTTEEVVEPEENQNDIVENSEVNDAVE